MTCILAHPEDGGDEQLRHNPPNAKVAHCFQLHDTVVNLFQFSFSDLTTDAYLRTLDLLAVQIEQARQANDRSKTGQ